RDAEGEGRDREQDGTARSEPAGRDREGAEPEVKRGLYPFLSRAQRPLSSERRLRSNERTGSSNTSDEHVHPADRSRLDVVERLGTPSWGYLREFVERMWIGQRDPLRIRDREREVESPDEKLADEGLL